MTSQRFLLLALLLCIAFTLWAYIPYCGRFLRSDDFARIHDNQKMDAEYFRTLLTDTRSDGFYRPLNHLSFGLTYRFFGLDARAYGLFNGLLLVATVVLLFTLIFELTTSSTFAALTTFAWLLNLRVISAALWWAVGRTTLLASLFGLLALWALLKARRSHPLPWAAVALISFAAALLSKESSIVFLPLLFGAMFYPTNRHPRFTLPSFLITTISLALVLTAYFTLRSTSHAMTLTSAPDYYSPIFSPLHLVRNLLSYLERSLLFSILVIPLVILSSRKRPSRPRRPSPPAPVVLLHGLILLLLTFAPTLALPERSSLYAFLPSLVVAATVVALLARTRFWPRRRHLRRPLLAAMLLVATALTPLVWRRGHDTWVSKGNVYRWARQIDDSLPANTATPIHLTWQPENLAGLPPTSEDLRYLQMALRLLRQRPIDIDTTALPTGAKSNAPMVALAPDPGLIGADRISVILPSPGDGSIP